MMFILWNPRVYLFIFLPYDLDITMMISSISHFFVTGRISMLTECGGPGGGGSSRKFKSISHALLCKPEWYTHFNALPRHQEVTQSHG